MPLLKIAIQFGRLVACSFLNNSVYDGLKHEPCCIYCTKLLCLTPNLEGPMIRLRPLLAHDFERLYAVACDPLIWAQHTNPKQYERPAFATWFLKALKEGALIIENRVSKKIIGSSRYYDINQIQNELAIGYTFLARTYWGGKINAELKSLMIKYAFMRAHTVWFHVGENNIRSQKAICRIGAIFSHASLRTINGVDINYFLSHSEAI